MKKISSVYILPGLMEPRKIKDKLCSSVFLIGSIIGHSFIMVLTVGILLVLANCSKEDDQPANVVDIDGNSYKTVSIGNKIWMAENLKTTKYIDGSDIPLTENAEAWYGLSSGGRCYYNNDSLDHKDFYGVLYNGYAVATGKLCPVHWHIPTLDELKELKEFAGDTLTAGGRLKEKGTDHWSVPNYGSDNKTGFSARGAGIRYFEGTYSSFLYFTGFWSGTESYPGKQWYISLFYNDALATLSLQSKKYGLSVRCVKD